MCHEVRLGRRICYVAGHLEEPRGTLTLVEPNHACLSGRGRPPRAGVGPTLSTVDVLSGGSSGPLPGLNPKVKIVGKGVQGVAFYRLPLLLSEPPSHRE